MGEQEKGRCGTFGVPRVVAAAGDPRAVGTESDNAAMIYQAARVPLRILVRNISPNGMNILISYDRQSLQPADDNINQTRAYVLPPGASDVFTLMPDEALYAISPNDGDGALLSYASSVAFPFEVRT